MLSQEERLKDDFEAGEKAIMYNFIIKATQQIMFSFQAASL